MFLCVFWFALSNRSLHALDYTACYKTDAIIRLAVMSFIKQLS